MTQPALSVNHSNFAFLSEYNSLFLQLAQSAERASSADPNTTLIKLRQFAEAIAQEVAACSCVAFDAQTTQAALSRVNNLTQSILAKVFRDEFTAYWRVANPELISGENNAEVLLALVKAERAKHKPTNKAKA